MKWDVDTRWQMNGGSTAAFFVGTSLLDGRIYFLPLEPFRTFFFFLFFLLLKEEEQKLKLNRI